MTKFWILEIKETCRVCNGKGWVELPGIPCPACGGNKHEWIAHCPGTPGLIHRYGSKDLAEGIAVTQGLTEHFRATEVKITVEGYVRVRDGERVQTW
jgi:DnaJ-class molecular chaperone